MTGATAGMPRGYRLTRALARLVARLMLGWRVEGEEHIPPTGGFILAANHVSYVDPPLIGAASPRRLGYLAKQQLFAVPLLGPVIRALGAFPIRREGLDRQALAGSRQVLAAGCGLLVFPTGTRIRAPGPLRGRPGVSLLAAGDQVPVVPVWIEGSARLWSAVLRRRPLRIRFGAPLPPPPGGEGPAHRQILRAHTQQVMEAIEGLAPPGHAHPRSGSGTAPARATSIQKEGGQSVHVR